MSAAAKSVPDVQTDNVKRPDPKRGLYLKLAEVMLEVERVPKSGRNEFHRYDYATEADIVAAVRKAMGERGLMLIPTVHFMQERDIARQKGGTERLVTLRVAFTLVDGDTGQTHEFEVFGEGTDAGDKASYKAMTGATKYALLKLFLIPTGDDPEQEEAPKPQPRQHAPKPQQQQRAPAPAPKPQPAPQTLPTLLGYGPNKGKRIELLTLEELNSAWHTGSAALDAKATPDGKPLNADALARLADSVAAVSAEREARMAAAAGEDVPY